MDSTIKKRLSMDINVYPATGVVDGDTTFGNAFILKGYLVARETTIITRGGQSVVSKTTIYLDGDDWQRIKDKDEVQFITIGRLPIQKINYYPSLIAGKYELLEVLL